MKNKSALLFIFILLSILMAGCAKVQPWEREYLADPIMRADENKEDDSVQQHFLNTIEGSSGGFGTSGGGCGCN